MNRFMKPKLTLFDFSSEAWDGEVRDVSHTAHVLFTRANEL